MTRFDYCVGFVLDHENVYDDDGNVIAEHDPKDPGGITKYGIDQRSHPNVVVSTLSEAKAREIYRVGEWTKCQCDLLPAGWDLAVFDAAVNIGSERAAKMLQKVVGAKRDGIIGPKTLAAVNIAPEGALDDFLEARRAYYRSLPARLRNSYEEGWMNRVADVRQQMVIGGMMA